MRYAQLVDDLADHGIEQGILSATGADGGKFKPGGSKGRYTRYVSAVELHSLQLGIMFDPTYWSGELGNRPGTRIDPFVASPRRSVRRSHDEDTVFHFALHPPHHHVYAVSMCVILRGQNGAPSPRSLCQGLLRSARATLSRPRLIPRLIPLRSSSCPFLTSIGVELVCAKWP
jgi:hypothetical protein